MIGVTDGVIQDTAPVLVGKLTLDTYVCAKGERLIAIGYVDGDMEFGINYQEARVLRAYLDTALGINKTGEGG